MAIKIEIIEHNFINVSLLMKNYGIDTTTNETIIGKMNEQIIPSIYLVANETLNITGLNIDQQKRENFSVHNSIIDTIAIDGLALKIFSKKENILLCYELYQANYAENYDPSLSLFYPFLVIPRNNVVNYDKKGEINFLSINPKKSTQMLLYNGYLSKGNSSRINLASKLSETAIKTFGKFEKEVIEKTGYHYELEFLFDDTPQNIEIVCEEFYNLAFEQFIINNWSSKDDLIFVEKSPVEGNTGNYFARLFMLLLACGFIFMMIRMIISIF